jgi:hypothetical protein
MAYGDIYHPVTGEWLASVKDGKITGAHGVSYSVVEDQIMDANGNVVGYLAQLQGPTKEAGDLADKLFRRT